MTPASTTKERAGAACEVAPALDVIALLASTIGPRRPCSPAERGAAEALVRWLGKRRVEAVVEGFRGYASFGYVYGTIFGGALIGGLVRRRRPRLGWALSSLAAVALALEADLRIRPVSALWSRRRSVNVVGGVAPAGEPRQRVCLVAHLDSSRSGLIFHPRVVGRLPALIRVPGLSTIALAVGPLLRRLPRGEWAERVAIGGLVFALAMLAERELRGNDVAGASDNASGCGVVAQLAAECSERPLRQTQLDFLITGCEESGLLGAEAYMRQHRERATGTAFINFDTVGGDVPLTYILMEGGTVVRPASQSLVELAEQVARERPELGLRPGRRTAGLPTDVTAMLARGHEGITFLAQGETIPNYHWPTDTFENVSSATVDRALECGRAMLAAIDGLEPAVGWSFSEGSPGNREAPGSAGKTLWSTDLAPT
jgi:hypothetical protein